MMVEENIKNLDTAAFAKLLGWTREEVRNRFYEIRKGEGTYYNKHSGKTTSNYQKIRAYPFIKELTLEEISTIAPHLENFPGFYEEVTSMRNYPFSNGANILGYLSEVDTNFLKRHKDEGYQIGDYAGKTGLERTYEKVLMGQRGIEYWKRDNKNRLTERLENGRYDTTAIAGNNMHLALDIELQELGEKLMENKLGSIVAVDPKTGGILALVSSPSFKPKLLTGAERKKHIAELLLNPAYPLFNRAVSATYSPGSTFKTLQALVGLHEGVISTDTRVSCGGAFYGCGSGRPMKCLDVGTFDMFNAIRMSDNTYFATVMQRVINNPKYPTIDSSLGVWKRYMSAFGLGHKLGVDVPSEKGGLIPSPEYYNKVYGQGKWNYCTFRSVSIGQGEVNVTPIQVANEMCYIANKGYYIVPHMVDSIEGGDKFGLLDSFKTKHSAIDIPDSVFEVVHNGMQAVVERGTGTNAKVEGIAVCGKTGTVENYIGTVKQPNHAFFCGFAPRDNPKIAIMCVVENSGRFGGTYAAPIVGLMIEKYLKDSITDKRRLARIDELSKLNLIPKRIYTEMRRQDSLLHSRDSAYLIAKGYIRIIKDTMEMDEEDEREAIDKIKTDKENLKNKSPQKDTAQNKNSKTVAVMPDKKKKDLKPESFKNID
jgi:penicillin-binding protein 2